MTREKQSARPLGGGQKEEKKKVKDVQHSTLQRGETVQCRKTDENTHTTKNDPGGCIAASLNAFTLQVQPEISQAQEWKVFVWNNRMCFVYL